METRLELNTNKKSDVIKNTFFILIILISIYVVLMWLSYLIPNELLAKNVNEAVQITTEEFNVRMEYYPEVSRQLEQITDIVEYSTCIKNEEMTSLENAMSSNGYARYWHGYTVFLRPFFVFFDVFELRSIVIFLFFVLVFVNFALILKRISVLAAFFWAVSLLFLRPYAIPMSIGITWVFFVTFISSIFVFYLNERKQLYLFLITGSVANFLDLLTAPLLTLGIPLALLLISNLSKPDGNTMKQEIKRMVQYSIMWFLGYGITWGAKWLIASVILQQNVVKEALDAVFLRVGASGNIELNRLMMHLYNIGKLFSVKIVVMIGVLICLWVVLFLVYKKEKQHCMRVIPLLILALYPYIWYNVLANHSEIHRWFTYRIQMITLLSLLFCLYYCIDFKKIKCLKQKPK